MSLRREWFERQMGRLYAARGLQPNAAQIAEYWRAIGDRREEHDRSVHRFHETEVVEAFTRAIDAVPVDFQIWPVRVLLALCGQVRAERRPSRALSPDLPEPALELPPPDVVAKGRQAVFEWYLGPKPAAAEPEPKSDQEFQRQKAATAGAIAKALLAKAQPRVKTET